MGLPPLSRRFSFPLCPFLPPLLSSLLTLSVSVPVIPLHPLFLYHGLSFLLSVFPNVSIASLTAASSTRTCQLTGSRIRVRTNRSIFRKILMAPSVKEGAGISEYGG